MTPLTPGEQQRPCVFHIIAAGRPDPVKNCSTHNVNNSAFQIHCTPGFNGGLPLNFTVEPRDECEPLLSRIQFRHPLPCVHRLDEILPRRLPGVAVVAGRDLRGQ